MNPRLATSLGRVAGVFMAVIGWALPVVLLVWAVTGRL